MSGGAKKGNKNALKHGLSARHVPLELIPELRAMPTDEYYMELMASRVAAAISFQVFMECSDPETKMKYSSVLNDWINTAANLIQKQAFLKGDAPVLQELWDAIDEVNRLEGVNVIEGKSRDV
jgi:hypothetical protein